MNRTAGTKITHLRPYLSAKSPVVGAERSAKREVMAVTRALSGVVRGRLERSEPMETRVEEMTPVSKPKRRPEIPAERVR
jgi:hypothetical protein